MVINWWTDGQAELPWPWFPRAPVVESGAAGLSGYPASRRHASRDAEDGRRQNTEICAALRGWPVQRADRAQSRKCDQRQASQRTGNLVEAVGKPAARGSRAKTSW